MVYSIPAAILTAFYHGVDKSVIASVKTASSTQIAQLPSTYTIDTTIPTVELGAVVGSTTRESLISSFIPFSWDQMGRFFKSLDTAQNMQCYRHEVYDGKKYLVKWPCERTVRQSVCDRYCADTLSDRTLWNKELQQIIFDAVNAVVSKQVVQMCLARCVKWSALGGHCQSFTDTDDPSFSLSMCEGNFGEFWPPLSYFNNLTPPRRNLQGSSSTSQQQANQKAWAQDQKNKNTINKAVKKKGKGVIAAALRGLQTTATSSSSGGVSIAFSTQLNTNLLTTATGAAIPPSYNAVVALLTGALARLQEQIAKSAQKLMTTGYIDVNLNTVKASSPFVKALASGTAVAGGITDTTFTVIQADMSDVVYNRSVGAGPVDRLSPRSRPAPVPVPVHAPVRLPVSAPVAKPVSKPTTKPTSKPTSKPTRHPTKKPEPTRRPTRRPTPEPTESEYTDDEPPTSYTDDAQTA